jgi:hypothetical protein
MARIRGEGGKFDRGSRRDILSGIKSPEELSNQVRTAFRKAQFHEMKTSSKCSNNLI